MFPFEFSIQVAGILTAATLYLWLLPFKLKPMQSKPGLALLLLHPLLLLLVLWHLKGDVYTFDFQDQIRLIHRHVYERAHPIIYTLMLKWVLYLCDNWRIFIILQLLGGSLACAVVTWAFRRCRMPWLYALICNTIIIAFSYDALFLVGKDAPYYISSIILTAGLCAWLCKADRKALACVITGLTGVALYRFDGQLVALLTALCLLALVRRRKLSVWRHAALLCIPLGSMVFCHGILPELLHAQNGRVGTGTKYAMPAELLCEVIIHGGSITPEEKQRFHELVLPENIIRACHDSLPEYRGEKYIWCIPREKQDTDYPFKPAVHGFNVVLTGKGKELFSLLLPIAWRNPGIIAKHLWDQSYIVTSFVSYTSAAFYVSLLAAAFLLLRMRKCENALSYLLPFVPVWCIAFICSFVMTTYELRYGAPIIGGAAIIFFYTCQLMQDRRLTINEIDDRRSTIDD